MNVSTIQAQALSGSPAAAVSAGISIGRHREISFKQTLLAMLSRDESGSAAANGSAGASESAATTATPGSGVDSLLNMLHYTGSQAGSAAPARTAPGSGLQHLMLNLIADLGSVAVKGAAGALI